MTIEIRIHCPACGERLIVPVLLESLLLVKPKIKVNFARVEVPHDCAGSKTRVANEPIYCSLCGKDLTGETDIHVCPKMPSPVRAGDFKLERMPCPTCGKNVYISTKWNEWACSDPSCEKAHGPGPGGGIPWENKLIKPVEVQHDVRNSPGTTSS